MKWLEYEHKRVYHEITIDWSKWTFDLMCEECAYQKNSYDCGAFVIRFIDFHTLDHSLIFNKT